MRLIGRTHLRLLALLLLTVAAVGFGAAGTTTTAVAATDALQGDALHGSERAHFVEIARADPGVRARMALRPGTYVAETVLRYVPGSSSLSDRDATQFVAVVFRSSNGGRVSAQITTDDDPTVTAVGQAVLVMPDSDAPLFDSWSDPIATSVLALAWLTAALVAWPLRVTLPLAIVAITAFVQFENVVSLQHVRAGNIALYGIPVLAMLVAAGTWTWRNTCSHPRTTRFVWIPVAALCAATATIAWTIQRTPVPIDVAYASHAGADLMSKGLRVYGNMLSIDSFLYFGDTYGPAAYLAYVPGALASDLARVAIPWSNLTMWLVLAPITATIVRRAGRTWRDGIWTAAAVCCWPPAALGVATGSNDIVVAILIGVLVLVLHRPIARGAALAFAVATKYIPVVLISLIVRHRGERRADAVRALAACAATGAVLLWFAVHSPHGMHVYLERLHDGQFARSDIASAWGLLNTGTWPRYLLQLVSLALATRAAILCRRHGVERGLWFATAALTVLIASLPNYAATYWTILLPLIAASTAARPSGDGADARRFGTFVAESAPNVPR